jgi:hypothetical protein
VWVNWSRAPTSRAARAYAPAPSEPPRKLWESDVWAVSGCHCPGSVEGPQPPRTGRLSRLSRQKLEYVDTTTGERYVPHVVEPAAGVGRTVLAPLCDAYDEDEIGGERRTVLRLHPAIAPIKVGVPPLHWSTSAC